MISRRQFHLLSLGCGAAASTSTFAQASASSATARPNIILFLSDDHGWDLAGCYGNSVIQTPNLDGLAAEGLRFTRAFAGSPTCSPSRAIIYTGMHAARNGTMGNHTDSHPGLQSVAQYLKAQGYRVVIANKADVRPKEVFDFEYVAAVLPAVPGRERRYRGEGLDTKVVDQLLADHRRNRASQPLCLICGDNGPHVVWEKNHTYDPAKLPLPPIAVDTPMTRTAMANYYQDITSTDRRLGEVLASVKRHGFEQNSLFIYTSDQGPEWPRSKWTLYDSGLRVPFVARWPGQIKPGAVTDAIISFTDITPTFVDIGGGKPIAGLDGASFRDVLLGRKREFRTEIFATHTGDGEMNMFPQRCIRDQRYKYILNLHPERKWTTHYTLVEGIPDSHREVYRTWEEKARTDTKAANLMEIIEKHPAEELYDTRDDPWELKNLASDPKLASTLARLRERMRAVRKQLNDVAS
jgi:N-sulfoglucosamine sulfohydrolase